MVFIVSAIDAFYFSELLFWFVWQIKKRNQRKSILRLHFHDNFAEKIMKKAMIKKLTPVILLVGSIVLFSCGKQSGISLTKRHYRNGYNIEISGNENETKTYSRNMEKKEKPEYAGLKNGEQQQFEVKHSSTMYEKVDLSENSSAKGRIIKKVDENKRVYASIKGGQKIPTVSTMHRPSLRATHLLLDNKVTTSSDEGHYYGGLIWTIIAVLLVLWLLSLLTGGWGLGGFLYIFLVVALVLIALRLLSII